MKADFTRDTFDAAKHYTRVLMQQGRVQLDADWNEQAAILLHYLQTLAADLIGPYGGPADNYGFLIGKVTASTTGTVVTDLSIGDGHYYVDGILCEKTTSEGHPSPTYYTQPDYPSDPKIDPLPSGNYLVYLDVWERLITSYEDNGIREVALGGPDTATRAKVVWQVKVLSNLPEGDVTDDAHRIKYVGSNWPTWVEAWQPTVPKRGMLKAKAKEDATQDLDACAVPPDARYRGKENQLYRVEIHTGSLDKDGNPTQPTFKWSRENGSVIFPIRKLAGNLAYLDHLGRDGRFGLKVGDWVEIVDDAVALHATPNQPGPLAQVEAIDPLDLTATLKAPANVVLPNYAEDDTSHPLLRRWDHHPDKPDDTAGAITLVEGTGQTGWPALEDGIYIQFQEPTGTGADPTQYRTGDYWLIPARTATGDVEWPQETDDQGRVKRDSKDGHTEPLALPPHGVEHHYAPLALVGQTTTAGITVTDVRHKFSHVPK